MSTHPEDPDVAQMQESLDDVAQHVADDPELAAELTGVLQHLKDTPIDPTGAPE